MPILTIVVPYSMLTCTDAMRAVIALVSFLIVDGVISGGGGALLLAETAADATATVGWIISGDNATFLFVALMLIIAACWTRLGAKFC